MAKIVKFSLAAIGVIVAFRAATVAAAIVAGQVDDFENGGLQAWTAGGISNPNPPTNISSGGPAGLNDNYMLLRSHGLGGAGGKLVVFNQSQWIGDYLGAAVGSIQMQVNNLGSTNLVLRLILEGAGMNLTTLSPVNLAAGSGWNTVTFSLDSANLTGGTFNTVMGNVITLDLVHSPGVISFRSLAPNIAAQLGVDNITALPKLSPVSTWNIDANGAWSGQPANWTNGTPNGPGAAAVFGGVITAPRTVTVNVPITVGRIEFDNANAYTIAGTNILTLDATSGDAEITVKSGGHTISAPLTLADNTLFNVVSATSNLSLSGALSTGTNNLTKAGAGALTLNDFRSAGLSINAGKVLIAPNGPSDASVFGALSIAGGAMPTATLDVTNNAAVLNYTGASPVATVRSQILAGRGGSGFGATWTGIGITSSNAAAANVTEPESRSVGYAENASLPLGAYSAFRGQTVDDTTVLMAYTRTADANLDGVVNDDDVTIIGATYAPGVPNPNWALGDFDYNGFVDDDDVTLLGVFYNPAAPPIAVSPQGETNTLTAIPEPSTIALWLVAACIGAIHCLRRIRFPSH